MSGEGGEYAVYLLVVLGIVLGAIDVIIRAQFQMIDGIIHEREDGSGESVAVYSVLVVNQLIRYLEGSHRESTALNNMSKSCNA